MEKRKNRPMDQTMRKTFQGVSNIVRFNWHFYTIAILFVSLLLFVRRSVPDNVALVLNLLALLAVAGTLLSLAVSLYVYDLSGLYKLDWMDMLNIGLDAELVNIHAGFDETSDLIARKYPHSTLQVFDFYNPTRHTELSIERARKAYPRHPATKTVDTSSVPFAAQTADCIFGILAFHEIRNRDERVRFLKQMRAALKPGGSLVIVEHLRDLPNFIAYNFGFFHFLPEKEWCRNFTSAGLTVSRKSKLTPFITIFILKTNGTES